MHTHRWLFVLAIAALLLPLVAACRSTPTVTPTPPATDTLYVALVWHQHQPLYYKDPATGLYTRPWVRVHATKDYYDMAAMLKSYPDVHVTFNLTPVLIRQLDDYVAGARDVYWALAEKPAAQLSDDDKRFVLTRFFDANYEHVIGRFPRYQELLDKRGGGDVARVEAALASFSEQDLRDLQVWFNLAWFDPDFLAQAPLKALVEKGRGFSEDDKKVVFDKALAVIKDVVPIHKELQDAGQIEVITTPYSHPILPLLLDSDLAQTGNPAAVLQARYSYPADATAQLKKSVEIYKAHFGRAPRGLWPGEGAVAQQIVPLVANAGFTWMASGELVLARSRGVANFARDGGEVVQDGDGLYRPYVVNDASGAKVNMVFRDTVLSDKIGFTYSGTPGEEAAADFVQRLEAIKSRFQVTLDKGPHLVTVILDGENAWENYPNDGKEFLDALYRQLSASKTIKTVTPSEYLRLFPQQKTLSGPLFPGAWFSANYDTWIGEDEENLAWDYLLRTRQVLAAYDKGGTKTTSAAKLARAQDFMYLAEGSDWFWWYGDDQNSGDDGYFDTGYRALLGEVYTTLGEPVPDYVNAPIIAWQATTPQRQMGGMLTPAIDGRETSPDEWAKAGLQQATGGAMARTDDVLGALYYGVDATNLYLRLDAKGRWSDLPDGRLGVYLAQPRVAQVNGLSRASTGGASKTILGASAARLVEVTLANGQGTLYTATGAGNAWQPATGAVTAAVQGGVAEVAVPLAALGDVQAGDTWRLVAVATSGTRDLQLLPAKGPAQLIVPDTGIATVVLDVEDPKGDDKGPGTYTYPTDGVFKPGVFDIKQFTVGYDDKNLVCKFTLYGPVPNDWNSGLSLSLQTFDVYIDRDPGAGTGNRLLLPGRNAALEKGNGWDVALWAEGWTAGVYAPDAQGVPQQMATELKIIVDAAQNAVTLRVPLAALGTGFDPARAGYVGVVLSQEGYPSPGVWRVRNVGEQAEQWKFGGGPKDTNHTRVIDAAWPAAGKPAQAGFLGQYAASQEENMDKLTAGDFAQVPLLRKP